MKKLGLLGMGVGVLLAGAAFAQTTNEVTSVNVVGYYKVTIPQTGYALAALNLDSIDPTNQNVLGIFGTQLRAAASPISADQIHIWDPAAVAYKKLARKSTDGLYHLTTSWSGAATNPTLVSGQAFWLKPMGGATSSYDVTVMGEVVAVATQLVGIVTGYQLVGNPFSTDISIDDLSLRQVGRSAASPISADQLHIWNGTAYQKYALKSTDGKWHSTSAWTGPAASNIVAMGQGFWYLSRTNVTWAQTNSYIGNLK